MTFKLKSLFVGLVLGALSSLNAAEAPRPNIVLILCDDLGYADVGFNGSKDIRTPHLDALAKEGTIFSSAYVTHPFCGPSRMGLFSGRYPHAFGAPFNISHAGGEILDGIPESEILMGNVLQSAGYYTGAVGKWHMGYKPEFHPNKRGFDDYYGFLGGGHMYFPEKFEAIYARQKKAGKKTFNDYILPLEHNGKEVKETEYITDALTREAVRFVKEASVKKEPFFLYLAYNAPHSPLEALPEDMDQFPEINDEKRKIYAGMVYAVDRGVGLLVKSLKEAGEFENTLIVFLSDNGGKLSLGGNNFPLSQGKGSTKEGGFRVPMFFHWPEKVPAGKHYEHPVSALDFYPTFSHLAGAKVPEGKKLDGKNIWSDFLAGKSPRPDELIYALRHRNGLSEVSARKGEWKIYRYGHTPWKLFNLDQDISEKRDLSGKHPELVKAMVEETRKWSETHTEPEWFDTPLVEKNWKAARMPKYERLFQVE